MKKKGILLILCLGLFISGCGGEEKVLDQEGSFAEGDCTYLEEGLVVNIMLGNRMYYEYETGTYMPLCSKANCLHDTDDCMAVHLSEASGLGKIGDKWYYLMVDGYNMSFYSADLDGQNERKIGTIGFGVGFECLFYEDSCIYEMTDWRYNEETGKPEDYISTIRRYDFKEQKEEILCPEMLNAGYGIYGRYEDQLIYVERKYEGFYAKTLNLETGEVTDLIGETDGFINGILDGNIFAYMIRTEGKEGYQVMELDLETGEQKEIWKYEGDMVVDYTQFAWGSEMKAFSISSSEKDERKTYLYKEDGSCQQIREEKSDPDYRFLAVENGQVIAEFTAGRDQYLAKMSIEDFTAGKDNWIRLEY